MKRLFLICAMAVLGTGQSLAQLAPEDYKFFNHLSGGISLGLDGIGFEVAAPMTCNFAVRAGYTFLPRIKYSTDIKLDESSVFSKEEIDIEGKLKMGNFHLLFDYYPFRKSSFHLTAGALFSTPAIASVYNTEPFIKESYWGNSGIELGDTKNLYRQYSVVSDESGNINLDLKVNAVKPYIGVGFGRAVTKHRVGVQFDLGVQFWGRPGIFTNVKRFDYDEGNFVVRNERVERGRITTDNEDYQDVKEAIRIMEKIRVYPVLKIRVAGRIF